MGYKTLIEWADHTLNLWWGCVEVHAGCDNCYARMVDKHWGGGHWGAKQPRRLIESAWKDLAKFQRLAAKAGEMHRVFVNSMSDIFEKPRPLVNLAGDAILNADGSPKDTGHLRDQLFSNISEDMYPNLVFLFLTKRPGNILKSIPSIWETDPLPNVMYGTSPVNQKTYDDMVPKLLQVPGKHFLSCEPLLGAIDMRLTDRVRTNDEMQLHESTATVGSLLDWVIVGGESGPKARPMHPDWARSIRDQCEATAIPFFFKQWGEYRDGSNDYVKNYVVCNNGQNALWNNGVGKETAELQAIYAIREWKALKPTVMSKIGKHIAGRMLDGEEFNQLPIFINQ